MSVTAARRLRHPLIRRISRYIEIAVITRACFGKCSRSASIEQASLVSGNVGKKRLCSMKHAHTYMSTGVFQRD